MSALLNTISQSNKNSKFCGNWWHTSRSRLKPTYFMLHVFQAQIKLMDGNLYRTTREFLLPSARNVPANRKTIFVVILISLQSQEPKPACMWGMIEICRHLLHISSSTSYNNLHALHTNRILCHAKLTFSCTGKVYGLSMLSLNSQLATPNVWIAVTIKAGMCKQHRETSRNTFRLKYTYIKFASALIICVWFRFSFSDRTKTVMHLA